MRTLEELESIGLRGKELTDAAYEDMFGHPPPKEPLTPQQRQEAWKNFLALRDTMTPEELNDGFMDHRKHIREMYDSEAEAAVA